MGEEAIINVGDYRLVCLRLNKSEQVHHLKLGLSLSLLIKFAQHREYRLCDLMDVLVEIVI